MHWPEGFIAVDWGTTNRRAYRIGSDGGCGAEMEDDRGILSVAKDEFPDAVAQIRTQLGDLPLLMAGMVGSNRGWIEAPYLPCPAGLDEVAAALVWAEPERTAIVPGVCFSDTERADVMRGEEVQILGAAADGMILPGGLVCHPGTHNKWITLSRCSIASFRTVMTGEMFSLLKDRSILADMLAFPVAAGDAFRDGVRAGLKNEALTASLFSIRASVLLGRMAKEDAASFASGLLIGADVRAGIGDGGQEVAVMGRPELTALYAAALAEAGVQAQEVDGETAFLAGARHIMEAMQ